MTNKPKDCPIRHENGNCLSVGGFCPAVNVYMCEAVRNAYDSGRLSALREQGNKGVEIDQVKPLTLDELREMDGPVWVSCKPIEGGYGYWCLCKNKKIITPAGSVYAVEEIPHWVFYHNKPKEAT